MKSTSRLVALITLVSLAQLVAGEPLENGENVCLKSVPTTVKDRIETPVEYNVKYDSMCGILPCVKSRKVIKLDQTIQTRIEYIEKRECCPGYAETADRKCAPICLKSCNNGQCVAPNVCKCRPEPSESSPGFVGPTCGRFTCLLANRWGSKCERECECPENSYCSASNGKCLCHVGWRGENCTAKCDLEDACDNQDSLLLPPIIEPEVNLIKDSETLVVNGRLSALAPEALEAAPTSGDLDEPTARAFSTDGGWQFYSAGSLVTFLLAISCFLAIMLFIFERSRYRKVKNELYYASCASGSSDSGSQSDYYGQSLVRQGQEDGAGFLEKNLTFDSATRAVLQEKPVGQATNQESKSHAHKILLHPRVESHLITSKVNSQQNHYSEVAINTSGRPEVGSKPSNEDNEEHTYQVPKKNQTPTTCHSLDVTTSASQSSDDSTFDNIYEEIKPTLPKRN